MKCGVAPVSRVDSSESNSAASSALAGSVAASSAAINCCVKRSADGAGGDKRRNEGNEGFQDERDLASLWGRRKLSVIDQSGGARTAWISATTQAGMKS